MSPSISFFTIKLIVLIACFSVLLGCRKLVQDKFPDFIPVPTINSILIAGDPLKVHVSLAGKIEEKQLDYIENAKVLLYVNNQYIENLFHLNEGIYTSQTLVEPLNTYKCEVVIPGFDTVFCSSTVPVPSSFLEIVHINNAGKDEEGLTYPAIQFSFSNNPNIDQYFEVNIRLFEYEYEYLAQIHTITDPVLLNEGLVQAVFSNELIEDSSYNMTINYSTGSSSSTDNEGWQTDLFPLIVELRTINYDYYQYLKKLSLYETGRFSNIVSGVVTSFPLYSNIENAYGIFSGYSKVASDTIYPITK